MKQIAVVADTTPATKSAYGTRGGGLLPFRGDSALFVDPNSLSMLVIDPAGKIARIMAAPRANDVIFLLGGPQGNPGFDAKGRLVYRAQSFGPPRGGMAPVSRCSRRSFPTACRSSATICSRASSTPRRSCARPRRSSTSCRPSAASR